MRRLFGLLQVCLQARKALHRLGPTVDLWGYGPDRFLASVSAGLVLKASVQSLNGGGHGSIASNLTVLALHAIRQGGCSLCSCLCSGSQVHVCIQLARVVRTLRLANQWDVAARVVLVS